MNSRAKDIMLDGILRQNPTFKLVLGTCPTLALTSTAFNAFGMGVAVMFVLIFTNFIISSLRNFIPSKVRLPAYILIIATFVTICRMLLFKYIPNIAESLGTYLPLIAVNCIIMARAEAFASRNKPLISALDGLSMGLGFFLSITFIGIFREMIGAGSFFDIPLWNFKIEFFTNPPGALFTYAFFIAGFSAITNQLNSRKAKSLVLRINLNSQCEVEI